MRWERIQKRLESVMRREGSQVVKRKRKRILYGGPKTREIMCTPLIKKGEKLMVKKRSVVAPREGLKRVRQMDGRGS